MRMGARKTACAHCPAQAGRDRLCHRVHGQGRHLEFVGHQQRIFPIGRLDKGSEGQIRRMAAHLGCRVKPLVRVRIGTVRLGHQPGQWRNLTDAELRGLLPAQTDW
jgi:16S rRNA U516 pseudouridylate synthase RsuA-like enzyme